MNVKKVIRTLFSPDIFKFLFFFVSILGVCPLIIDYVEPFFKLFHIYALIVLVFDLLGEKRILRNKGRMLLVVFAACYMITILTNQSLLTLTNLSNFCYLLAELGLIFSYGEASKKIDRISSYILCTVISLCNAIGIWMFFSKAHIFIEGRGYIGIFPYENRLSGFFGNPNVLGLVCLCTIGLCAISFILSHRLAEKIYFGLLCGINVVTLLLSNSRTQIYALILMCAIIAFFTVLKSRFTVTRAITACVVSILCAALVSVTFSFAQRGLSKFDINYDFYLQNICLDYERPSNTTLKNGIYTEDGVMYYYENDKKTDAGLINIDGTYYYVDSSCKVVTGTHKIEKTNDILPAGTYEFGEDGKLLISDSIKNGIYTENDVMYYYEDNKKTHAGLIKLGDDYYYIDSSCKVVVGSVNITKTNGLLPAGTYKFDEDGKMIISNWGDGIDPEGNKNQSTIDRLETEGLNGRVDLWLTGLKLFKTRPLFGYGLDNLDNAVKENGLPPLIAKGNLHNTYIDVLVGCGLAGFICLVLFLLIMLINAIKFFRAKNNDSWMFGAIMVAVIAAFMLDGMADSTLIASFHPSSVSFWFVCSQFASLLDEHNIKTGIFRKGILNKLADRLFNNMD